MPVIEFPKTLYDATGLPVVAMTVDQARALPSTFKPTPQVPAAIRAFPSPLIATVVKQLPSLPSPILAPIVANLPIARPNSRERT